MTQPIFLIGPRGCGKTTLGHKLADALKLHFVDTDRWISEQTALSVADIVAKEGWVGFRSRESQALQAVNAPGAIVATGGGIVLASENCRYMQEQGIVIYLQAPVSLLVRRLQASPQAHQRPTLTGKPIAEEIEEVLREREPLYQATAHHVIDASLPVEQIIERIRQLLHLACAS